jgi:protein-tyrosine phosphatase
MNILFVCTANVSRSYLAEVLLKSEIPSLNQANISVSSAGLRAFPGSSPDPKMVEFLKEKGLPVEGHTSRQIKKEDVEWADLILVMEKGHRSILIEIWPEAKGKVNLLGGYISGVLGEDDIIDPFGRSSYHYRLAQSQISLAIKALARSLWPLPSLPERADSQL